MKHSTSIAGKRSVRAVIAIALVAIMAVTGLAVGLTFGLRGGGDIPNPTAV